MALVAQIFALLGVAFHVMAFVLETLLFERPSAHQRAFGVATEDVPAARPWAFNIGFYNLFLASGGLIGVIAWWAGNETVGKTLVIYACAFMFLAGAVLFLTDRLALGRPRGSGVRGALAQSIPPGIALVAAVLS